MSFHIIKDVILEQNCLDPHNETRAGVSLYGPSFLFWSMVRHGLCFQVIQDNEYKKVIWVENIQHSLQRPYVSSRLSHLPNIVIKHSGFSISEPSVHLFPWLSSRKQMNGWYYVKI